MNPRPDPSELSLGDVHHLKNVKDFAGSFAAITTAAAVGGRAGFTNMQNGNGVFVQLHATGTGGAIQGRTLRYHRHDGVATLLVQITTASISGATR
jgi:hypothetical protein